MEVTTEIPWGDGSGDKIYLTRNASEGDQVVSVSSDANTGNARSKVVTFTSGVGNIQRQLTINQAAGVVEHTITLYLSSYDSVDKSYYSLTGASKAYSDPDNNTTDPAGVSLKRGSGADTWVYWKFDTSSLPANANIVSVSCKARTGITNQNVNNVASKGCVMCSGTTIKTDSIDVTTSNYLRSFVVGNWTREELNDVRLKLYAQRGTNNTSTNYILRMYGAELTIKYTI